VAQVPQQRLGGAVVLDAGSDDDSQQAQGVYGDALLTAVHFLRVIPAATGPSDGIGGPCRLAMRGSHLFLATRNRDYGPASVIPPDSYAAKPNDRYAASDTDLSNTHQGFTLKWT
jgi:hypothetical protein